MQYEDWKRVEIKGPIVGTDYLVLFRRGNTQIDEEELSWDSQDIRETMVTIKMLNKINSSAKKTTQAKPFFTVSMEAYIRRLSIIEQKN